MALKRTKLLGITSVTGINTVGIFTVGVTDCTGPVGIASTTYVRGIIAHNTGLDTCTSTLYAYPGVHTPTAVGDTSYRLSSVDLAQNETFFFEPNYPIVLRNNGDRLRVRNEGIASVDAINVLVNGDIEV